MIVTMMMAAAAANHSSMDMMEDDLSLAEFNPAQSLGGRQPPLQQYNDYEQQSMSLSSMGNEMMGNGMIPGGSSMQHFYDQSY